MLMVRTRSKDVEDVMPALIIGAPIRGKVGVKAELEVKVGHAYLLSLEDRLGRPLPSLNVIIIRRII